MVSELEVVYELFPTWFMAIIMLLAGIGLVLVAMRAQDATFHAVAGGPLTYAAFYIIVVYAEFRGVSIEPLRPLWRVAAVGLVFSSFFAILIKISLIRWEKNNGSSSAGSSGRTFGRSDAVDYIINSGSPSTVQALERIEETGPQQPQRRGAPSVRPD